MSELKHIPITVETESLDQLPVPPLVKAVLLELMDMVVALDETGATNFIDIKSLPLMQSELEQLRHILGKGEVEAIVEALGPSQITETLIPGVWWVTHKNAQEEVVSEFIEVTTLPEILVSQHEELWNNVDLLKARLSEFGIEADA